MKHILVHLTGGDGDESRLSFAENLAVDHASRVTGILTNPVPDLAMFALPDGGSGAIYAEILESTRVRGEALRAALAERLKLIEVPTDLIGFDQMMSELGRSATATARTADLFVATAPYSDDGEREWGVLVESVLFGSGRGTLILPPKFKSRRPIRKIVVAWQETREAARAVGEALALVSKASCVEIVLVDPDLRGRNAPASDIARYLSLFNADVVVKSVASGGRSVAEALLEEVAPDTTDLIVMGGYGHSRAREWVLGGTTRDMLTNARVPVLIAH